VSKTQARQIRRIGLLKTTYTEHEERRLVKDATGKDTETIVTIKRPERHREQLTIDDLKTHREQLIADWQANRKKRTRH
jgi:hypothetical protein